MSTADSKLDARLREVPLPGGLLNRLVRVPLAGDEDVDELLREVALPPSLLERLQAAALADDDGLDEALRNVRVPDDLVTSCRHPARKHFARRAVRHDIDRLVRISRIATAISLILAVTLSLGGAILLSRLMNLAGNGLPSTQFTQVNPARPAEPPLVTSWLALSDDPSGPVQPPLQAGDDKRDIELAEMEATGAPATRDLAESPRMPRRADPLAPWVGTRLETIGPNRGDEGLEHWIRPADLIPHGLDWPLVPGGNRELLRQKGFHPFVSPAAHPRLQTCPVPLAIEPSSYELARRYLERNEWPPANRVRTEEFLAAVDYNFPKPKHQALGLIVAGGPSPISGEGYCLLQVGVQARQNEDPRHAPLHVVLLIDTSTSMRWGSRMEIIRRALRDLPGTVGPQDRLSLVTFNQAAHVLVENLNREGLAQFAAAADSLTAEGATNIAGGLIEAYGVARPTLGPGRPAVRVVLLTDGLLDLDPATAQKIEEQVAQAAQQNIPLDVIDLGQQKETDPQVASLAQNGRGTVRRATSAEQVRWALREIVTGRSQVVAQAARLQVTFNPKSVLEYRLLGHESGEWGGLLPGPLEADFRDGQTATALFEVRLAADGSNDLGAVELTWYAPDGQKTLAGKTVQTARTTVERKHFAASLTSSAPSLQEAAVVAYMAEVLRHSPFIFRTGLSVPNALYRAVELSDKVDSQLRRLPSFEEFVTLVHQEMKAHPSKRQVND